MELTRYDAAVAALAEITSLNEVKDIRDKQVALEAYAKQAKDDTLLLQSTKIRLQSERRLGEILIAARETGQIRAGRPSENDPGVGSFPRLKLADANISLNLSSRAQKLAGMPDDEFTGYVERIGDAVTGALNRTTTEEKAVKRAERERDLGEKIRKLPNAQYGVILADPPWRFDVYSRATGLDRAADNHYPTMTGLEISSLPVRELAAPDCALLLWTTAPKLGEALDVMAMWGFAYKTHMVWMKERTGTGFWYLNMHELLLLGVKGEVPAPAPGRQAPSVMLAAAGKHSEKPEAFLEMIEEYFPTLPKIELFRRGAPRDGWDAWGNEVDDSDRNASRETAEDDA